MSRPQDSQPEDRLTHAGRSTLDQSQSELYSVNPSPPVFVLTQSKIKDDYENENKNMYYDVMTNEKLIKWAHDSQLAELINHESEVLSGKVSNHKLFMVRRSKEGSKNHQMFVLPDRGESLSLSAVKKNVADIECVVLNVGQ